MSARIDPRYKEVSCRESACLLKADRLFRLTKNSNLHNKKALADAGAFIILAFDYK